MAKAPRGVRVIEVSAFGFVPSGGAVLGAVGEVSPLIDDVRPITDAAGQPRAVAAGKTLGRVVIRP